MACIKTTIPRLLVLACIQLSITACQTGVDPEFQAFTKALGQPHDLGVESDNYQLMQEPLRPLPRSLALNPAKVSLGKRLFNDTRLSKDNSVSCASCHDLASGGDDGRRFSIGVGGAVGTVNAPTVLNSGLNFAQFWNGRAKTLQEQADGPVNNPNEMASNWDDVIKKLSMDEYYQQAFRKIYSKGITSANITDAIAQFERSLITPSPFDRYLRGENDAISTQAQRGYKKFKHYGCVSCHQGINVGGNMFQKLGALVAYFKTSRFTDADRGRAAVTNSNNDLHVFKVPSLRNVAVTAPYFHDGSIPTLDQAIRTMAALQLGRKLPDADVSDIKAFLGSLTGHIELAQREKY